MRLEIGNMVSFFSFWEREREREKRSISTKNVSHRGKRESKRENENAPAALKVSHDVQKSLVHVTLVATEAQFHRSHVHERIVGGLRVRVRVLFGVHRCVFR
jgi:hypothetical protein